MTERLKQGGEDPRAVARTVNRILEGKINSVGTVTLSTGTTTTLVADFRAHANSKVLFQPTTANAASEWASGAMWATCSANQIDITHSSATETDLSFGYVLLG